jgi:hypothetical protein
MATPPLETVDSALARDPRDIDAIHAQGARVARDT